MPRYEPGDYIKVEFPDETAGIAEWIRLREPSMPRYEHSGHIKMEFPDEGTGIAEWMWVRVERCDDEKQIVFGRLDNEPVGDYGPNVGLGSELAIRFAWIRDHKKPEEFLSNN